MRPAVAILTLYCSFSATLARTQPQAGYSFHHISQTDGLLNNTVSSLTQDNRGFIWIATKSGLQRYDGARFVNYRLESGEEHEGEIASGVYFDAAANQLVLTARNHIKQLDLLSNRLKAVDEGGLRAAGTAYNTAYKDGQGASWILGSYYVLNIDPARRSPSLYACSLPAGLAKDLRHRQTWIANGMGLLLFDEDTRKLYSFGYNPLRHPLLQVPELKQAKGVTMDSQNNLWINSWSKWFYKFNILTQKMTAYSLDSIRKLQGELESPTVPLQVNAIFEDDHHTIWLATSNAGLLRYDRVADRFMAFITDNTNSRSVQYNYEIFCVAQDKDENIWLGTDKGISFFNPYQSYFKAIAHEPGVERSLPKREITCYTETAQGDVLVGTWGGGISLFDSQLRFKKTIFFAGANEENLIWCFVQNDDGKVWIGCQHGYLHIYDPSNGAITTIHPAELENSTVRCMKKDSHGNILLGLHNGKIAKWDRHQNKFYPYRDSLASAPQFLAPVTNILIDKDDLCWVSTERGFSEFDEATQRFTSVPFSGKTDPGAGQAIPDTDSSLLMGMDNGGLVSFNKRTRQFTPIKTGDTPASFTVSAIDKDKEGNLWFTTDYNLFKYIPSANKCIRYNMEPAVINSSFEPHGFYHLRDGRWLIATSTEVICFRPDSLDGLPGETLPVEITGMKIFDRYVFVDSLLSGKKPVWLSYRQNFLTIEFATLHFAGIKAINYHYRLSDIDKDWVSASALRSASYTDLAPGDYTFSVMTEGGSPDGKATSFRIIIAPPFWQTWWCRAGGILLVGYVFYLFARRRIKAIRREAGLKQQIVETEMMALRAQMNPHFIFNCINSIDALIQSNDKYQATVYLNKFARLIRNILDSSKQNTVALTRDFETLKLYIELEQFRNENKFGYEINVDPFLLQDDYRIPPLIIQPYVENAILHGLRHRSDNKGKLLISVSRQKGQFVYLIEDNGVGRDKANSAPQKDRQSYGIQMSNERVKLFNKEAVASVIIEDLEDGGRPAGTKVTVSLNIQ
jgi:ligand-binding sensor domain-containing protein